MEPIIEFQDFSFKYSNLDFDIIHNANFSIEQGDTVLIFGPSGSGKSTLCYSMVGLIPWSIKGMFKGKVKIYGQNLTEITPRELAGTVGLVMQNPDNQFINLTVFDELIFGAENLKVPEKKIRERLDRIVQLLGLEPLLKRNPLQLSGGEKQRVVLGSVLMMKPKILILDEPLAFLDAQGRLEILHHILKLKRKFSNELTILIAEHRINEIVPLANKFILIDRGKIKLYTDKNMIIHPYFQNFPKFRGFAKYEKEISTVQTLPQFSYDLMIREYSFTPQTKPVSSDGNEYNETLIVFDKVSFSYIQDLGKYRKQTKEIFTNISFEIKAGEIIGIVGPNGSGKTTLLYLIAGILSPDTGTILFKGTDLKDTPYSNYAKNIGLIFQNPESQILKNKIIKELEFGPRNFGLLNLLNEDLIDELISLIFSSQELVLEDALEQKTLLELNPFNLSWGQKRRVNLASLYTYAPLIYLLDEPFTGQDFLVRKEIMDSLIEILGNEKAAVISSHDEEILNLCSKVFLIEYNQFYVYKKSAI
ncbi:MAG: ABC transporter ATP-binding protein [Promethearchaeota archaeon]